MLQDCCREDVWFSVLALTFFFFPYHMGWFIVFWSFTLGSWREKNRSLLFRVVQPSNQENNLQNLIDLQDYEFKSKLCKAILQISVILI